MAQKDLFTRLQRLFSTDKSPEIDNNNIRAEESGIDRE
jgi:hypothetical protein